MSLSKLVLKRPVSTLLCVLALVFFGFISYSNFTVELTPEISMPMYMVMTVYPGASPEDVDENVTKKLEEQLGNLSDVKEMDSRSSENMSMVIMQYNYGTNMAQAYDDLKKKVDQVSNSLDDDVEDPYIVEMDMNAMPSMVLVVKNSKTSDVYNYVVDEFQPEIEKISSVAQVNVSGGQQNYISVMVKPEEMKKYNLSMNTLNSIIANADFSIPGGSVKDADQDLSVSTSIEFKTVESLKSIPITTGKRDTIYLEDIADISFTKKDKDNIGRYDGEDTMIVMLTKSQSSSVVDMSKDVQRVLGIMQQRDPSLDVTIIEDSRDKVESSLNNVLQTMFIAIVLSMLIIYLFLGDVRGSLIIGTSIPLSLLMAIILMSVFGFTLNMVTLSSLVLGVGMMVDNSIVILEGCFRSKEKFPTEDVGDYIKAALDAVKTLGGSVLGSTITTCVVFAPLATIQGMIGQMFRPLGLTIVFCMMASYISAITIVPLCYVFYRPQERDISPLSGFVLFIQRSYRHFVPKLLKKCRFVICFFMMFFVATFFLMGQLETELMAKTDDGMIRITVNTKPSLRYDEKNALTRRIEEFVQNDENVEHYQTSARSSSLYVTAYLKDDRKVKKTDDLVSKWRVSLSTMTDCTLDIQSYSSSGGSGFTKDDNTYQAVIQSVDYDKLKQVNDEIVNSMISRGDLVGVHSDLENASSLVKVKVDPILAAAEGFQPAMIGSSVRQAITGVDVMDMIIDGDTTNVLLEYPKNDYNELEKVENLSITSSNGTQVLLKDIAEIVYADSPKTISKKDKYYQSTITASYGKEASKSIKRDITEKNLKPYLTDSVQQAGLSYDQTMNEELGSLMQAMVIAVFLVFLVMAMQFESIKHSLMVMFTVLFAFVGSIFMIWVADLKLSMTALLGFMMLIGTAVNNGILYVDSVNQMKEEMPLDTALVETGAIRYRPMLMTTLTTIIAMIPMSIGYGDSGELMQALGLVNVGGLITSTIVALYLMPELYKVMTKDKQSRYTGMGKKVDLACMQLDSKYFMDEGKKDAE